MYLIIPLLELKGIELCTKLDSFDHASNNGVEHTIIIYITIVCKIRSQYLTSYLMTKLLKVGVASKKK